MKRRLFGIMTVLTLSTAANRITTGLLLPFGGFYMSVIQNNR